MSDERLGFRLDFADRARDAEQSRRDGRCGAVQILDRAEIHAAVGDGATVRAAAQDRHDSLAVRADKAQGRRGARGEGKLGYEIGAEGADVDGPAVDTLARERAEVGEAGLTGGGDVQGDHGNQYKNAAADINSPVSIF